MYNFKSIVSIMRYVILLMTPIPYMDHSLVTVKGHHQIVNTEIRLIIFFADWRSSIQSAKTRPRADCGSDRELFIEKNKA